MSRRRRCIFLLLLGCGSLPPLFSALPAPAEAYVAEALEHNRALALHSLDVAEARARLAQARSALQPRLDLIARYTRADGGRTIEFPVGTLLNGVYGTLNELLRREGRPAGFPQLANQEIALLRPQEQETRLRLVQPLWRPELTRTARAGREAAAMREAQLAAFRRELRLTVLTAYFNYLQAEAAVAVFATAEELTVEALRTNRALAEAGKITDDRVLRAEADALTVQQQSAEAVRDRNTARAYLNFLVDRDLKTPVQRPDEAEVRTSLDALLALDVPTAAAGEAREELRALERGVAAAAATEDAVRARLYPTLALAVDGGIQGERYGVGREDRFVQGSLVAEVNVWDGRQRRSELQVARLERRRAEVLLEQTRRQLRLEVEQAGDELRAAIAAVRAARHHDAASARAFALVQQREQIGLVNQLTFVDARSEFTRAQLNRTVADAKLFIAAAAFERALASTPAP